ncbi:MAG: hypothetical protein HOQ44_03725 [Nocardia sp.]|nr:hypothetical protein [Nocardia sp.]
MTVVGYSAGAIVAADFRLDDSRTDPDDGGVYVGKASNDLNAHAGHAWLGGPDPIDPEYGATRIKAETPESYSSPIGYSMEAH